MKPNTNASRRSLGIPTEPAGDGTLPRLDTDFPLDPSIRSSLEALCEPLQPTVPIWREALARRPARRPLASLARQPIRLRSSPLLALAAMLVIVIAAVMLLLPSLGKARSSARHAPAMAGIMAEEQKLAVEPSFAAASADRARLSKSGESLATPAAASVVFANQQPVSSDSPRHVIRNATIELRSGDVPAAFAKASLIVSEPLGEFIERSSLSGNAPAHSAEVVLRVAASRLATVLTQLRALGVVTSEHARGDDVTDRLIDLDARLRNERRIEDELLKLFDARPDAPLEDVLKLRTELSRVRLGIEQLDAQRQHLGRAVSLATILVIIRADGTGTDPAPTGPGLGDYFGQKMSRAWSSGLKGLANSASFILENLLAGLVWWIALLIGIVIGVALLRRAYHAAANEPAPRI